MKLAQVKLTKAMDENNICNLAVGLRTTRQTLYNLKDGKRNPEEMSISLARELKKYLGIDYEDWFEVVEE